MTNEMRNKTISEFMSRIKEDHPEIHTVLSKNDVLPIFQTAASSIIDLYEIAISNGSDQTEAAKGTIRVFGNTCRNNAVAISGIGQFNDFIYNRNLSRNNSKNEIIKRLNLSIKSDIEVYEDDEDELSNNGSGKIVQSYICVYIGEMRSGLGADIRIIDSVEEYFKWFIAPYDLKVKDIKVDGSKLTADLQVDEENGLDVEIDFNDRDSFVKLEEDIDVTLFPDGSPWRTDFYPVYEGEPLKVGEIFSDSFR